MLIGKSREELEQELSRILDEIARHPYNSPVALASTKVIEEFESAGQERVNEELLARGLPPLQMHGLMTAQGMISFGRLHRKRKKLLDRLKRKER